jgi:hypothetical protein
MRISGEMSRMTANSFLQSHSSNFSRSTISREEVIPHVLQRLQETGEAAQAELVEESK